MLIERLEPSHQVHKVFDSSQMNHVPGLVEAICLGQTEEVHVMDYSMLDDTWTCVEVFTECDQSFVGKGRRPVATQWYLFEVFSFGYIGSAGFGRGNAEEITHTRLAIEAMSEYM